MNFNVSSTGQVKVTSNIPVDTYGNYLNKFLQEVAPVINNTEALRDIVKQHAGLKSWRLLNREVRRSCDQYCTDNGIMDHATYQAKFFYEGTMIGRTTYGKDAPWADGKTFIKVGQVSKPTVVDSTGKKTKNKQGEKTLEELYDLSTDWGKINYGIAKRIAEFE